MDDLISKQVAIDALWKALYEYEDKTEKQFIDSEELDVGDWMVHSIFVQNMNDIDRQTILNLPSAQTEQKVGKWLMTVDRGGFTDWFCSSCGGSGRGDYRFCPWCNAKMEEQNVD